MINISKMKIYVAEFTDEHQLVSIDMFDVASVASNYFVGLSIESPNIVDEFSDFERWRVYDLLDINELTDPGFRFITTAIKDFTCIDKPLDEVINSLLDDEFFVAPKGIHINQDKYCREMYLKTVIKYKTNKQINKK